MAKISIVWVFPAMVTFVTGVFANLTLRMFFFHGDLEIYMEQPLEFVA